MHQGRFHLGHTRFQCVVTPANRAILFMVASLLGHVGWISKALMQALELAPPSLTISIQIYVTSGEPPATSERAYDDDSVHDGSSGSQEKKSAAASLSDYSAVTFYNGRPDLCAVLRDEVSLTTGRMSVTGECSCAALLCF